MGHRALSGQTRASGGGHPPVPSPPLQSSCAQSLLCPPVWLEGLLANGSDQARVVTQQDTQDSQCHLHFPRRLTSVSSACALKEIRVRFLSKIGLWIEYVQTLQKRPVTSWDFGICDAQWLGCRLSDGGGCFSLCCPSPASNSLPASPKMNGNKKWPPVRV